MNQSMQHGKPAWAPTEDLAIQRFQQALRQAMVVNGYSERKLAAALGITIGTTQKYFRGKIHPSRVATEITRKLARSLGTTIDALVQFYDTGQYEGGVDFEQVVAWMRSSAGAEHLAPLLAAMSAVSERSAPCSESQESQPLAAERYDWPLKELQAVGMSDALRERMGLGDEVMERLAATGQFDDALVEAFSVAVNLEEDAVREAFTNREPVA